MRIRVALAALACTGLVSTGNLQAQNSRAFCDELFTQLTVGEYARWRFEMKDQREMTISIAVVDRESQGGEELYWIEMMMPMPVGGTLITAQMLVPGFPFDAGEMLDYIVQYGDQPPVRVPAGDIGNFPGAGWREECRNTNAEYVGIEKVTLEGVGTFDAHHVRTMGEEPGHWFFTSQVPFAMLKFESVEGSVRLVEIRTDYLGTIDRSTIQ